MNRSRIAAALRAKDEQVIRNRGGLAAIMAAPNEDAAVRRAALVLHTFTAWQVVQALAGWRLLNTRPERVAS